MASKQDRAQTVRDRIRHLLDQKLVKSQKDIAAEIDLDPGQLSRFMKRTDDQGLSDDRLTALERVLDFLTPKEQVVTVTGEPLKQSLRDTLGTDDLLDILAHKLRNDQLALFVGAGISHLAPRRDGGPQRLPLWKGLSTTLAHEFFPDDPHSFDNPLDLFDAIIYEHPDPTLGRRHLEQALTKHLDDKDYAWSDTHRLIQDLPWHAIFTTNYDNLLTRLTGEKPVASEDTYYRLSERPVPRLFPNPRHPRQPAHADPRRLPPLARPTSASVVSSARRAADQNAALRRLQFIRPAQQSHAGVHPPESVGDRHRPKTTATVISGSGWLLLGRKGDTRKGDTLRKSRKGDTLRKSMSRNSLY